MSYATWADLERNVPIAYREAATAESFREGMSRIAPPGMRPREGRVSSYERGVDGKAEMMVERWKRAMFE